MTKHNKKRNIGIMYELLLRHISSKLIEGDKRGAKVATTIIEKRFAKNTELYKEFRLFNALAKSSVEDTAIAAAILTEAKNATKRFNHDQLRKEKSRLIKDINYKINDKDFYYRSVPDYRQYANIHNMLREWEKKDRASVKNVVILEQKALDHLLSKKDKDVISIKEKVETEDANILIERIMSEKINKKYSNFSDSQRQILQKYALYSNDASNHDNLKKYLTEKKKEVVACLEEFAVSNDNEYIANKISLVESKINNLNVTELSDATISKFLTLTNLVEEINKGE